MLYFKELSFIVTALLIIKSGAQQDHKRLAKINNDVGLALLNTFPPGKNVIFSPLSIYIALAMAYGAAREGTAREMHDSLGYERAGLTDENIHGSFRELLNLFDNGSDKYKLQIANAILAQVDYTVLPEYKELLQKYYKALLKEVDFAKNSEQAVKEVNSWVNQKTNGKIPKLLDRLSSDTRMILLNAIYFKGTWKKTFDANSTKQEKFYNGGVNEVQVPMMKIKETFPYASFPEQGFQAIELPYKGEDIGMLILLPNEHNKLNNLEKRMNANRLNDIVSKMFPVEVDVKLPKFKLEDTRKLKENLKSLGMQEAFSGQADFSGISGKTDLYISEVVHKAMIEVNEEGSEAAAATAVIFLLKSSLPQLRTPTFRADHPFLFFIRDRRTNMILFGGRVNNL